MGGLIVDRKEVKYGTIDQMSREEVEKRLEQLLGQTIEAQATEVKEDVSASVFLDNKEDNNKEDTEEI